MNLLDKKYTQYALCSEMLQAANVVRNYNANVAKPFVDSVLSKKNILFTGEGSSRIFPSKHFQYQLMTNGLNLNVVTEGATQALEYDLNDYVVFGVSNSGKTKELVELFQKLTADNHSDFYGISATPNTPVVDMPKASVVLDCGKENAVAATKSVMEQALFFDSLLFEIFNIEKPSFETLSNQIQEVLSTPIDSKIVKTMAGASLIYFAGRNNGVAEELTLKTNEITRKKSNFLEGTYALHGIEEVMTKGEVLVIVEPFEAEEEKFKTILEKGVGIDIIAISSRETVFPTIKIPDAGLFRNYAELAAGWNLLVETGLELGVNLDKPVRARKIGNEMDVKI